MSGMGDRLETALSKSMFEFSRCLLALTKGLLGGLPTVEHC
jgi:hypothetical protein